MYTYQDLLDVGEDEKKVMDFVGAAISAHKLTELYETAKIADEYARHQNRTIMQYQKMLYTISGKTVPDNWSANYKIRTNYFNYFVTQQTQFLLGNGVSWEHDDTGDKLGDDFDTRLQEAGKKALIGGEAFGFWNYDHVEVFSLLEFVPLYDEENGALMAGVRFWQIDSTKPLRATLYQIDGYTEYIWEDGKGRILQPKRQYVVTTSYSESDGLEIFDGQNYPSFPIVPLWGNQHHQSEIIGLREQIDAYDLIKSGFANDLDDVSQIYWTISNAGGMDDIDLAQFVQRMKTVKAASVEDGQSAEAHTLDVPYSARETLLDRLRRDMFRDYMALDPEQIASGAVTATQIKAAYEPLNVKADEFEYCVIEFVKGILAVAGIDDDPTFTRSMLVNRAEEIQTLVMAAQFVSPAYVTEKILSLMGDADRVDEVLEALTAQETQTGFMTETVDGGEMVDGEEEII